MAKSETKLNLCQNEKEKEAKKKKAKIKTPKLRRNPMEILFQMGEQHLQFWFVFSSIWFNYLSNVPKCVQMTK